MRFNACRKHGVSPLQVRARHSLVYGRTSLCVRRLAASMRPPFGLFAITDHRRSGAPTSTEARSQRAEARSRALHLRGVESCRAGVSPAIFTLRNRRDGTRHACPTECCGNIEMARDTRALQSRFGSNGRPWHEGPPYRRLTRRVIGSRVNTHSSPTRDTPSFGVSINLDSGVGQRIPPGGISVPASICSVTSPRSSCRRR
jgi:hypothetical protein